MYSEEQRTQIIAKALFAYGTREHDLPQWCRSQRERDLAASIMVKEFPDELDVLLSLSNIDLEGFAKSGE